MAFMPALDLERAPSQGALSRRSTTVLRADLQIASGENGHTVPIWHDGPSGIAKLGFLRFSYGEGGVLSFSGQAGLCGGEVTWGICSRIFVLAKWRERGMSWGYQWVEIAEYGCYPRNPDTKKERDVLSGISPLAHEA